MFDSVKILPLMAVAALMLLLLKAVGLYLGIETGVDPVTAAVAAEPAPQKSKADHANDKSHGSGHGGENHDTDHKAASNAHPAPQRTPDEDAVFMSQSEVEVLHSLSERRNELERRRKELDMREKLLAATQARVDERIAELKAIESRIESLLSERDKEAEERIASLVKVYETMKPKDAARIFESLDQDVLLQVVSRMREAKMASVMANMDPAIAQKVTVMLANRLKLPDDVGAAAGG